MNKKEVNELKKQLNYDRCVISRICGCYVDGNKQIMSTSREAFLSLTEELGFKYFDIMKHALSGTMGKNLMSLEFSLDSEGEGSVHELLLALKNSELKDDELLDRFYRMIIEAYDCVENYYIILTYSEYDVPKKGSDNLIQIDGSDEVYEYISCAICPVALDKAGLYFNPQTGQMEDKIRERVVGAPQTGFVFPAFTDRSSDIHELLYYTKKSDEIQTALIDCMGCSVPFSADSQAESFNEIIMQTLDDECDIETVKEIHENLCLMIAESEDSSEPIMLDKSDVRTLLERSGVSDDKLENLDSSFETVLPRTEVPIQAQNIANTRNFSINTPDVSVKVKADKTNLVHQETFEGIGCLVIDLTDSVEVNGVSVRPIKVQE